MLNLCAGCLARKDAGEKKHRPLFLLSPQSEAGDFGVACRHHPVKRLTCHRGWEPEPCSLPASYVRDRVEAGLGVISPSELIQDPQGAGGGGSAVRVYFRDTAWPLCTRLCRLLHGYSLTRSLTGPQSTTREKALVDLQKKDFIAFTEEMIVLSIFMDGNGVRSNGLLVKATVCYSENTGG